MREDLRLLDAAIERLLNEMEAIDPESDRYDQMVNQLERLYDLRNKDAKRSKPQRVSRDQLVAGGVQIVSILVIVAYEQKHVMTSSAFKQLIRPKT